MKEPWRSKWSRYLSATAPVCRCLKMWMRGHSCYPMAAVADPCCVTRVLLSTAPEAPAKRAVVALYHYKIQLGRSRGAKYIRKDGWWACLTRSACPGPGGPAAGTQNTSRLSCRRLPCHDDGAMMMAPVTGKTSCGPGPTCRAHRAGPIQRRLGAPPWVPWLPPWNAACTAPKMQVHMRLDVYNTPFIVSSRTSPPIGHQLDCCCPILVACRD